MKICGTVIPGDGRGRQLGFPTANLAPARGQKPLAPGVYAGFATGAGLRKPYPSAIHVGPRPTFPGSAPTIEAHLLDFSGDLYGQELCLEITKKLRDIQKFDTIEALQKAIADDCASVRELFSHS